VSNGPTEAVNNVIKQVKRAAFGFTSFRNYRNPVIALRRQAQLGPARDGHTPVKSEQPDRGGPNAANASTFKQYGLAHNISIPLPGFDIGGQASPKPELRIGPCREAGFPRTDQVAQLSRPATHRSRR